MASGFSAWVDDHWIIESPAVKSMLCNAEFGCYMMLREIQQYKQKNHQDISRTLLGHSTLDARPGRHGAREEIPGRG